MRRFFVRVCSVGVIIFLYAHAPCAAEHISLVIGAGVSINRQTDDNPFVSLGAQCQYRTRDALFALRYVRNLQLDLEFGLISGGLRRNSENSEWAILGGIRRRLSPVTELRLLGGPGLVRGWLEEKLFDSTGYPYDNVRFSTVGAAGQAHLLYRRLGLLIPFNINSEQSFVGFQLSFLIGSQ